jgi:hypothetical protein
MSLAELEQAVKELPPHELTALATLVAKLDNEAWDKQIEKDAASGKLDSLIVDGGTRCVMSVAEIKQELSRLSEAERIEILEAVRAALDNREEVEPAAWHADILAERAVKIDSGEATFLTIDQLKERLRR